MPPGDDVNTGAPPDTAVSDAGNPPGRAASDGGASKDFPGGRLGARSGASPSGDDALVEECEAPCPLCRPPRRYPGRRRGRKVRRHGPVSGRSRVPRGAGRPRSAIEIAWCVCRGHTIYRQNARSERPIHPGHHGRNRQAISGMVGTPVGRPVHPDAASAAALRQHVAVRGRTYHADINRMDGPR